MEKLSFILCLCFFQTLPTLSIETEKCSPSRGTIRKLENQYKVQIIDPSHYVTINYDRNIVVMGVTTDVSQIYLKKVAVNFTGFIISLDDDTGLIDAEFDAEKVLVYRSKKKSIFFGKDKYSCKVIDWDDSPLGVNSSTAELVIRNLTDICIQDSICKQYNAIVSHVFLENQNKDSINDSRVQNVSAGQDQESQNNAITSSDKGNPVLCGFPSPQPYNPQDTINAIFDFSVSAVISLFAGNDYGIMALPYIEKDYKFAGSTGEFEAYNGTFEDLRALYRVKDVVFTNYKDRFMVSTAIRLAKAKLIFPQYKLRYGIIKVNGHLAVDIDGLTVSLKLAADYNASPCELHLVDLNMDELGDTKVEFTGLGWPLNSAVRRAIRYIVENKIFEIARDIAVVKIREVNCEQFRPNLDMINSTIAGDNVFLRNRIHH